MEDITNPSPIARGELLYQSETYAIRGAVFEVYRNMGSGFLEAVYQSCLEMELTERGIPFKSKIEVPITYKNRPVPAVYQADLVCYDKIILELKAVKKIDDAHRAQLMNYLKATGLRLGLLINFGCEPKATVERLIH